MESNSIRRARTTILYRQCWPRHIEHALRVPDILTLSTGGAFDHDVIWLHTIKSRTARYKPRLVLLTGHTYTCMIVSIKDNVDTPL